MIDERVLGYDAREVSLASGPPWPANRRSEYLLRPDVPKPLSTDETVWPSVFRRGGATTEPGGGDLDTPRWTGPVQGLWDDLHRLTAHLDGAWGTRWQPCRLVAVTLLWSLCTPEERGQWDERIDGIAPGAVDRRWELLGYDVSDEWLLSGLMNCGYTADEVDALRRRWGPHLNEHHLFDGVGQAGEFVGVSDQRVEEHAPFFVYGIYSITHVPANPLT